MIYFALIVLLVAETSSAYRQESYVESPDGILPYEDQSIDDEDFAVERRNNQFLRFGRRDERFKHDFEDEYGEDFARPTREGKREKNDHFIRFGRGGNPQDFLRFGRGHERSARRSKENYLRFGRSSSSIKNPISQRRKREAPSDQDKVPRKRGGNFLRFGRNSNFMRFGRDPSMQLLRRLQDSEVLRLLLQLEAQPQDRPKTCA